MLEIGGTPVTWKLPGPAHPAHAAGVPPCRVFLDPPASGDAGGGLTTGSLGGRRGSDF